MSGNLIKNNRSPAEAHAPKRFLFNPARGHCRSKANALTSTKAAHFFIVVMLGGMLLSVSCRRGVDDSEVVARIDNILLTKTMLENRMAVEGYTPDQENAYIERWVDRQLLYAEAQRMGFHRSEDLALELKMIEQEFLINRLLEATFAERIEITEAEISAVYDQDKDLFTVREEEVRLRHLLTETAEEANVARQEIRAGKAFEEVARERSVDLFREKGGDMGYVRRDELIPEVGRVAFTLSPGNVSRVITSSHGYHLIQLVEKHREGDIKPLAEVQDHIRQRIRVSKERNVYFDLLYQLQNRNKITIAESYRGVTVPADSVSDADHTGGLESNR